MTSSLVKTSDPLVPRVTQVSFQPDAPLVELAHSHLCHTVILTRPHCEQNVDLVGFHQLSEFAAVAVDTKWIA